MLLVLTKDNAPPQSPWGPVDLPDRFARAEPALDTDAVRYFGFPVAFVVAETFEHATAAAALVHVRYEFRPASTTCMQPGRRPKTRVVSATAPPPTVPLAILKRRSLPRR